MTRPTRLFIAFVLALLIGSAGCGPARDDDSPEGLSALAERALDSGRPAEALSHYSTAMERFPGHPFLSSWQLGRGRSLLALGRLEEAADAAALALGSAADARSRAAAMLLGARVEMESGAFRKALETLTGIDRESLDAEEAEAAVELLRSALRKVPMSTLTAEPATGWVQLFHLLELEERYASEGNTEKAVLTGMEIDRLFPWARERYGRPDVEVAEGGFIALLLPLSGDGAAYARHVRSGVELAFERASDLSRHGLDLVSFDSSAEEGGISGIVGSLGANPLCLGVIGPLTSSDAELSAPLAQRWSLTMLTPTATSSNLDSFDGYVYRLVVSSGDEAAAVAEYAVRKAGCSTFAIIHEFTSESVSHAEQFRSVVRELGGEVLGTEGFETGTTDFRSQINSIRYLYPDAVFLPVTAWDAIQIAPQLRFYRVSSRLFGTSGWDDGILLEHGGEYVEGAVFPVSFGAGSMNPSTARFSYFYRRKYGETPTVLAAQGYDAARIILGAWEGIAPSRSSLENHLRSLGVYFGATGMCTLGNVSIPRSAYPLVTVRNGEISDID